MAQPVNSRLADRFDRMVADIAEGPLSREAIDRLLAALGDRIGTKGLALNEDGVALLIIDGAIELTFTYLSHLPGLIVSVHLEDVPSDEVGPLKAMLRANMSWPLTRGGIFSLTPGTDQVALFWLLLTHDRDLERIERELAEMVAHAKTWRDAFVSAPKVAVEAPPRPAPPESGMIRG